MTRFRIQGWQGPDAPYFKVLRKGLIFWVAEPQGARDRTFPTLEAAQEYIAECRKEERPHTFLGGHEE